MLLYFASLFHHCFSGMFTRSLSETTTQDFLKENESKIQPRCVQLNVEASLNLFSFGYLSYRFKPITCIKNKHFHLWKVSDVFIFIISFFLTQDVGRWFDRTQPLSYGWFGNGPVVLQKYRLRRTNVWCLPTRLVLDNDLIRVLLYKYCIISVVKLSKCSICSIISKYFMYLIK